MLILYNLAYLLLVPFVYPFILFKSRKRGGFSLKRRVLPKVSVKKGAVWIHCASIGEVNSIRPLVSRIKGESEVLITTLTDYGAKRAKSLFPWAKVSVLPLDILPIVRRFVRTVEPKVVLIYETELWPSLLYALKKENVRVFIISGKISERSFKGYKIFGKFFGKLLDGVHFLSKSQEDAERAVSIGFSRVKVIGDLKFELEIPESMAALEIEGRRRVILWGSTHDGEERLAEEVHVKLSREFPDLLTIVAPRHVGRVKNLRFNVPYLLRSESRKVGNDIQIYVVDTVGELSSLYRYCDVAVVGGSFIPNIGGHNPLEAVVWKKPVVIGNYHEDFRHIVAELKGGIVVSDRENVSSEIAKLLKSEGLREEISNKAYIKLMENRGVVESILKEVFG